MSSTTFLTVALGFEAALVLALFVAHDAVLVVVDRVEQWLDRHMGVLCVLVASLWWIAVAYAVFSLGSYDADPHSEWRTTPPTSVAPEGPPEVGE